jgi:hypothetical protein
MARSTGPELVEGLYRGNDEPDGPTINMAAIASAPVDTAGSINALACYVYSARGGPGRIWDVTEKELRPNDHWDRIAGRGPKPCEVSNRQTDGLLLWISIVSFILQLLTRLS